MSKIIALLSFVCLFASCTSNTSTTVSSTTDSIGMVAHTTDTIHTTDTVNAVVADTAAQPAAMTTAYRIVAKKDSIRNIKKYFAGAGLPLILAVNRVDADNIGKLDSVVIPADLTGNVMMYSPFPQSAPFLSGVGKIVYFSYPAQYFAAYENGRLVYTGPTNMGRKKDPTPTGLFFTNWKAEHTRSTFNDEWELKWNFNIENKEGIGWHQYAMPGHPASHSCLRLTEENAKSLYEFADEWVMKGGKTTSQGTPVIVFGTYPFGQPKPWYQLATDPHALDITVQQLQAETQQHMAKIMEEKKRRGK
ncbi:MAG: L,D-transpeptidase [Bacteroidota bacterium]